LNQKGGIRGHNEDLSRLQALEHQSRIREATPRYAIWLRSFALLHVPSLMVMNT
jgi:hypothetical protein